MSLELHAEHPLVMVSREIKIRVSEAIGPAALPIRVGNEWRYKGTQSNDEIILAVIGARSV